MLMESYMLLLMYVLCSYTKLLATFFTLYTFFMYIYIYIASYIVSVITIGHVLTLAINNNAMFYSIFQLCKSSGPIFSYLKIFIDEFMSHIYLVLIQFISILIFFTFFIYIFQDVFFHILFIKIQVIFINFPIPDFLAKKAVKFISSNTAN